MNTRLAAVILCGWCLVSGIHLRAGNPHGDLLRTLPMASAVAASTASWPEIPPETWTLKDADFPDRAGAVVLLERYHFHRRSLERFRRILVLSEPGRSLTDFQVVGGHVTDLEGRTVTAEGNTASFLQGQDVLKVVAVARKNDTLTTVKVIPPGVTSHCVVDVRWQEPIDAEVGPVPEGYRYQMLFSLSGPAPVKVAEVTFDADLADGSWLKQLETQPGQKHRQISGSGRTTYLFEDIPARQDVPLASGGDLRSPAFSWFWSPQLQDWLRDLGYGGNLLIGMGDAYACTIFYQYLMKSADGSRGALTELRQLGKGTESLPVRERCAALIQALRRRVKTIRELPSPPAGQDKQRSLGEVLKQGWGTADQLTLLAFHLLKEQGLDVSLVLAIDREDNRLGDPNNAWQFDAELLSVPDEKGEPIYLYPASTFAPLGLPPWFQGSKGMVIHPGKKQLEWTGRITPLPSVGADRNGQSWKTALTPGEDLDDYTVSLDAMAGAASSWRTRLFEQHPSDAKKAIAPLFEKPGVQVQTGAAPALSDPWKDLSFTFQASREHEGGRRRILQPFLFIPEPFPIPRAWPEKRTLTIHLPMKTQVQAETRIKWQGAFPEAHELEPSAHENAFGRVAWSAEAVEGAAGKEVVVKLLVRVNAILVPSAYYGDFKLFSSWIQEALRRGVSAPRP